jgi:hypothetical protein
MTDQTRITFHLTRNEIDHVQYAIARRRAQIAEYVRTCEATNKEATAVIYREEEATLVRCSRLMAQAVGGHAVSEINARNAQALQSQDIPTWMKDQIELD